MFIGFKRNDECIDSTMMWVFFVFCVRFTTFMVVLVAKFDLVGSPKLNIPCDEQASFNIKQINFFS